MKIIIADDHPLVLDGVREMVRLAFPEAELMLARSYPELLGLLTDCADADLILLDLKMPGMSEISGFRTVREKAPEVPLVVLTGNESPSAAKYVIESGARGYILKSANEIEIGDALAAVLKGETYVSDNFIRLAEPADPNTQKEIESRIRHSLDEPSNIQSDMLNLLPIGVIMVDPLGRVLFLNKEASEILSQCEEITIDHGGNFLITNAARNKELRSAVIKATEGKNEFCTALSLANSPSLQPLNLLVTSMPGFSTDEQRKVIVFITDSSRHRPPEQSVLRQLYDLTQAEAKIVRALLQGLKVDEAAMDLGISVSTVRSHLKRIFSKTGTNSQSGLIRLVMTGPAIMARGN